MALGNRRSFVGVAVEASVGSLDSSGLVDATGLTFTGLECRRATVSYDGQAEPVLQRDIVRSTLGAYAPEPETVYSGGAAKTRRTGVVTLTFPWRCPGSSTLDNTSIGRILRTVMGRTSHAAGASDTINDAAATTTSFQVTTPASVTEGDILAFSLSDRIEFTAVTDTGGGVGPLTVSPALSAAPANGATYRFCQTYFPVLGTLTFATYPTVALRVCTTSYGFYAVGCRLQKLSFSLEGDDGRTVMATAEMRALCIVDDSDPSAALVNPTVTSGGYAKFLDCYAVYSTNSIGTSVPAALARSAFSARRWSAELTWTLNADAFGYSNSMLGASDVQCDDFSARLSLTATPVAAFDTARRDGIYRSVLIGNSPNNGAGNGLALYMPAAFLPEYLRPAISDGATMHELAFQDGVWALDTTAFANGSCPNTSFRLGLVA